MIANAGFSLHGVESVNAVEAYLGSMPGNLFANVRRPLVNTMNLAHLLPLTAIWAGPDIHPCPFYQANSAPLLQAKPMAPHLTGFVCTRAIWVIPPSLVRQAPGKSTLLATLVAQHFRYPGAQAFVFDKGYSRIFPWWQLPVASITTSQAKLSITFCPLGQIDDDVDWFWAAAWLLSCGRIAGRGHVAGIRARSFFGQSTSWRHQRTAHSSARCPTPC